MECIVSIEFLQKGDMSFQEASEFQPLGVRMNFRKILGCNSKGYDV